MNTAEQIRLEEARELTLSAKTVEAHREHMKEKLNLNTSAELVRFAIQNSPQSPSRTSVAGKPREELFKVRTGSFLWYPTYGRRTIYAEPCVFLIPDPNPCPTQPFPQAPLARQREIGGRVARHGIAEIPSLFYFDCATLRAHQADDRRTRCVSQDGTQTAAVNNRRDNLGSCAARSATRKSCPRFDSRHCQK